MKRPVLCASGVASASEKFVRSSMYIHTCAQCRSYVYVCVYLYIHTQSLLVCKCLV